MQKNYFFNKLHTQENTWNTIIITSQKRELLSLLIHFAKIIGKSWNLTVQTEYLLNLNPSNGAQKYQIGGHFWTLFFDKKCQKTNFEPRHDSEKIYLFINLRCLFIDLPWLKKSLKYLPYLESNYFF